MKSESLKIPDDLSIPSFLLRKKGDKWPSTRKRKPVVIKHDDSIHKSMFTPTVMVEETPAPKKREKDPDAPSVQEYIRRKASAIIGELEGMIDDGLITPEWSAYEHARQNEWSAPIAKKVAEHFEPLANEILEVMTLTDDADLQYAYRGYTPEEITAMGVMFQGLVDEANKWAEHAKMLKPRKKKLPSMERVLKNFVYAQADKTYKLASIDPTTIIGAAELWVFHPKSKVMTVYRALDRAGLGIKHTTITNVDEKESVSKRMGRRTEERLEKVLNGGKIVLRKLMDEFVGEKLKLTRITKNHILLRVIK